MKLWSKGLGSKYILPLRLCDADLQTADGGLVLKGIIPVRKVRWWYTMAMSEADMVRFIRFVNRPDVTRFVAREGGMRLWSRIIRNSLVFLAAYLRARIFPSGHETRAGEPKTVQAGR